MIKWKDILWGRNLAFKRNLSYLFNRKLYQLTLRLGFLFEEIILINEFAFIRGYQKSLSFR